MRAIVTCARLFGTASALVGEPAAALLAAADGDGAALPRPGAAGTASG
jgi:hypothetical protein